MIDLLFRDTALGHGEARESRGKSRRGRRPVVKIGEVMSACIVALRTRQSKGVV